MAGRLYKYWVIRVSMKRFEQLLWRPRLDCWGMLAIQDRKQGAAHLWLAGFPDPATSVMAVPLGLRHTLTHFRVCDRGWWKEWRKWDKNDRKLSHHIQCKSINSNLNYSVLVLVWGSLWFCKHKFRTIHEQDIFLYPSEEKQNQNWYESALTCFLIKSKH